MEEIFSLLRGDVKKIIIFADHVICNRHDDRDFFCCFCNNFMKWKLVYPSYKHSSEVKYLGQRYVTGRWTSSASKPSFPCLEPMHFLQCILLPSTIMTIWKVLDKGESTWVLTPFTAVNPWATLVFLTTVFQFVKWEYNTPQVGFQY